MCSVDQLRPSFFVDIRCTTPQRRLNGTNKPYAKQFADRFAWHFSCHLLPLILRKLEWVGPLMSVDQSQLCTRGSLGR